MRRTCGAARCTVSTQLSGLEEATLRLQTFYKPAEKGTSFRQNAQEQFRKIFPLRLPFLTALTTKEDIETRSGRAGPSFGKVRFCPTSKNPLTSHAEELLRVLPRPPESCLTRSQRRATQGFCNLS